MKIEKVLSVRRRDPNERAIDLTRHLSGQERVSLLEDVRREVAKATGSEYPQRLKRVLTVVRRAPD